MKTLLCEQALFRARALRLQDSRVQGGLRGTRRISGTRETVYPFHPATIELQVSAADLELALEFYKGKTSSAGVDGGDLCRVDRRLSSLGVWAITLAGVF